MAILAICWSIVFAPHIEGSNADFARHMEGSHADFAQHMERRHSFKDQKIVKVAIFAFFLNHLYLNMAYLTTFKNTNILRERYFK